MLHIVKDTVARMEGVKKIIRTFSSIKGREMEEKGRGDAGVGRVLMDTIFL
jgi:hypothetical protein